MRQATTEDVAGSARTHTTLAVDVRASGIAPVAGDASASMADSGDA